MKHSTVLNIEKKYKPMTQLPKSEVERIERNDGSERNGFYIELDCFFCHRENEPNEEQIIVAIMDGVKEKYRDDTQIVISPLHQAIKREAALWLERMGKLLEWVEKEDWVNHGDDNCFWSKSVEYPERLTTPELITLFLDSLNKEK